MGRKVRPKPQGGILTNEQKTNQQTAQRQAPDGRVACPHAAGTRAAMSSDETGDG